MGVFISIAIGALALFVGLGMWWEQRTGKKIEQLWRSWFSAELVWDLDLIHQLKEGQIDYLPDESNWVYLKWIDSYHVRANGDFERKIEVMARNVSETPQEKVQFVNFAEGFPTQIWGKHERSEVDIAYEVDAARGVAMVTIPLTDNEAVDPGRTTLIEYGYTIEGWVDEKVDRYFWDRVIRSPIDVWKAKLMADQPWTITDPEASLLNVDFTPVDGAPPTIHKRLGSVYWTERRPAGGSRLRLWWSLEPAQSRST